MRNIVLIFSLLFSILAFSQKPNCKKFKNGDFTYIDPMMPDYEVELSRNDSVQTEFNSFVGGTITSKVVWKSDCEYELTYMKFEGFPFSMEKEIGKSYQCRILETDKNKSYKVHVKANSKDPGRIIIIKRVEATSPKS